jgi:hypothetical protein
MKFNAAIAAAVLAATTVGASPFAKRNMPGPACPAGCVPDQTNPPVTPPGQLKPTDISQYTVGTGAIDFDVTNGKIFKADSDKGNSITTLVTFDFPLDSAGKDCSFTFELDSTATLTGSGLFDVFTSLKPADHDTTTWGPGNQRDQNVGRMSAVLNGQATWVAKFLADPFPCPAGTTKGYELVGVYDNDDIEWNNAITGPRIHY